MELAYLTYGNDGFRLEVRKVAWWAYALQRGYERLLTALGEPCCYYRPCDHPHPCFLGEHPEHRRTWAGVVIDHLPQRPSWSRTEDGETYLINLKEYAEILQGRLLNNPLAHLADRRSHVIFQTQISTDQARQWAPDFVDSTLQLDDDDDDDEDFPDGPK